jgi:hypothetical protein
MVSQAKALAFAAEKRFGDEANWRREKRDFGNDKET